MSDSEVLLYAGPAEEEVPGDVDEGRALGIAAQLRTDMRT